MRNLVIGAAAAVGLACGLVLSGPAVGQDDGSDDLGNLGVQRAARVVESYKMSTKVNQKGVVKEPERVADDRTLFHTPEHFGQVFAVTSHGPDAVVWFKSGTTVRNAVVRRAADRLVTIEQVAAEAKDVKVR